MKTADFTRTEEIGEFDEIEIHVSARIISEKDGAGDALHTVDMDIYGWHKNKSIDLHDIIFYLCL